MNRTGVLLAVIMTALLGLAAWWALRPTGPGLVTAPGPIAAGVDAGELKSLTVAWQDGGRVRMARGPVAGTWMLSEGDSAADRGWPVDAETLRRAVRLLCDAEGQQAAGEKPVYNGPAVEMVLQSGRTVRAEFAADVLAGRRAVRVADSERGLKEYLTTDSLARLFEPRAVRSWRSRRGLAMEGPPSRIVISGETSSCILSRAGGAWGVIEPPMGRADDQAMSALVARLGSLELESFAEPGTPIADTGLTARSPTIAVESDRRAIDGEHVMRRTLRQTIRVGGRADVAGTRVFVELAGEEQDAESGSSLAGWGPVIGIADPTKLAAIAADPLAYVERRACDAPAADITGLTFSSANPSSAAPVVIQRSADGWTWAAEGGPVAPVPPEDVKPLETLLRLLCEQRADQVVRAESPPPEGVRIMLARRDAPPLEVTLRPVADSPVAALGISVAGLERRYAAAAWTPVMNWVGDRVRAAR